MPTPTLGHARAQHRDPVWTLPYARLGKRPLDVLVSAAALPVAALVMVPAAVAVRLEDGGPVLQISTCLGRDQAPFPRFTFRTTRSGAPELGASTHPSPDDPSCTRVGQVLRRTGIDALPQLLNVFIGQMSLVGPRPTSSDDRHDGNCQFWHLRYDVRPGITGLGQVMLPSQGPSALRCRLDASYAEMHSLRGDLWVLWRTVAQRLGWREAYWPVEPSPAPGTAPHRADPDETPAPM